MLLTILILAFQADAVAIDAGGWAKKAKPIVICDDGADCDVKWGRGAAWIREHSKFQIAVDKPAILATYGPVYANVDLSYVLTKRLRKDGKFDISARAWCGNVITCRPKSKDAILSLSRAIEAN